jgi:hypothetical protein
LNGTLVVDPTMVPATTLLGPINTAVASLLPSSPGGEGKTNPFSRRVFLRPSFARVIARSESDEAIQFFIALRLDCFAIARNDDKRSGLCEAIYRSPI